MKHSLVLGSLLSVAALAACAPYSTSGQKYERYETKTAYNVEYGEVVSAREVRIEGEYGLPVRFEPATAGRKMSCNGGL